MRLTDAEITRLAAFKGLSESDFIQRFTRLRWDRGGLALQEQPDGACVFLEGENCAVQTGEAAAVPRLPDLWNFPGFEQTCQALPREVNETDYERLIAQIKRTGNEHATTKGNGTGKFPV